MTTSEKLVNLAETTLAAALTATETTVQLTSEAGFPETGNYRVTVDSEIMLVTARSGKKLTVKRGQEGTTAIEHKSEAAIAATLTKEALELLFGVATGQKRATSHLELSSTYTLVPGCKLEVAPVVDSVLVVNAVADFSLSMTKSSNAKCIAELYVDSSAESGQIVAFLGAVESVTPTMELVAEVTAAQSWVISLSAGSHTIELRAMDEKVGKEAAGEAKANNTGFTYLLFGT